MESLVYLYLNNDEKIMFIVCVVDVNTISISTTKDSHRGNTYKPNSRLRDGLEAESCNWTFLK